MRSFMHRPRSRPEPFPRRRGFSIPRGSGESRETGKLDRLERIGTIVAADPATFLVRATSPFSPPPRLFLFFCTHARTCVGMLLHAVAAPSSSSAMSLLVDLLRLICLHAKVTSPTHLSANPRESPARLINEPIITANIILPRCKMITTVFISFAVLVL